MNELTTFLAQVWGPTLVLIGLTLLINRAYYRALYRSLSSEKLTLFVTGIIALVAGIVHVHAHTSMETFSAGVITVLGFATLLKGVVLIVMPTAVAQFSVRVIESRIFVVAAAAALLFGGYLVLVGYLY